MYALERLAAMLYAPVFFAGFLVAALAVISSGAHPLWLLPLLCAAIATSFAAEALLPYERSWNRSRGDSGRDALHAIVNEAASCASIATIPVLAAILPSRGMWPEAWPLWLQLAFAIAIADCGITLAHYASHRLQALWRLHAVHHSVLRMYGLNGLMKHPLHQTIETVAGTAPLLALGMPVDIAALLAFAVGVQLLLQHANIAMRVGPLVQVWAIAPGHRHHHRASASEGDVNFGLFTMLWDHLLGTFVADRPAPRDGDLGVAGRLAAPVAYPVAYWAQLVEPFRR